MIGCCAAANRSCTRGARGAGATALASAGVARSAAAGRYAAAARGACVRAAGPGRGGTAGVVPADESGRAQPPGRAAHLVLIPPALAQRGLAPPAQVGLQGGVLGTPPRRAQRARSDHQRADRLAPGGHDAAGARHPGTAARNLLFRDRDRGLGGLRPRAPTVATAQSRPGGADAGHAGRLSQLPAQAAMPSPATKCCGKATRAWQPSCSACNAPAGSTTAASSIRKCAHPDFVCKRQGAPPAVRPAHLGRP